MQSSKMPSSTIPEERKPLLTLDDVAKQLSVSPTTIYRWVRKRELPFYKLASALRFSAEDLRAFLEKRHVRSLKDYFERE